MALSVGCRACVHGVRARPELNFKLATVTSIDPSRGRCGVQVDGELVSLRQTCLTREDVEPWERCRHGGPPPQPAMMATLHEFIVTSGQINAPCLEHVRLFEPLIRRLASPLPPIVLASMGVDAYAASDYPHCRGFAVSALVLDALRTLGADGLFAQLNTEESASPIIDQLGQRLAKCTSAAGLMEVLGLFVSCECLAKLRARGIGIKQADIDPKPSPVDKLWETPEPPAEMLSEMPLALSEDARSSGERLGRKALELLAQPADRGSSMLERTLELRQAATAGHRAAQMVELAARVLDCPGAGRGSIRERRLEEMQRSAVAGMAFLDGGGIARLEESLAGGLTMLRCEGDGAGQRSASGQRSDRGQRSANMDALLLTLEVISVVQSPSISAALLQGRGASLVCELIDGARDFTLAHNAMRALEAILKNASPSEFSSALGESLLRPVVTVAGCVFHDTLQEDVLDFACLDTVCSLVTLIAGGSGDLAKVVGSTNARGVQNVIPTSLCIILTQHAHEQQAGRFLPRHPLGNQQHLAPINLALMALYSISLHFDLRVVRIGGGGDRTESLDEALAEYADFLHGFVHHQAGSQYMQAYLARLLAFMPDGAPPFDPRPRPIETEAEQHRRLMQYTDSLQRARLRVREQRGRGVSEATRRADEARARGNDAIRAQRVQEALDAYSEAVDELSGFESDVRATGLKPAPNPLR